MRLPIWLTVIAAVVTLGVVLVLGNTFLQRDLALLNNVELSPTTITPNADGDDDVALFSYEINRNAQVSLIFEDADGNVFVYRENEPRGEGEYSVFFGGVVDGFTLPGEDIGGEVVRRLIPNGDYTWTLTAVADDDGEVMTEVGTLTVRDADTPLPEMIEFTVFPEVFTPNQDGIGDRTQVNIFLAKDAELDVFLLNQEGERQYMVRREEARDDGEAGRHWFDYEGGVDIGADPPPDGLYQVVAEARDLEGQIIRRTEPLTIAMGGKPRAEIVPQTAGVTVIFASQPYDERYFSALDVEGERIPEPDDPASLTMSVITMPVGEMLVFKLTVGNYGATPIRTTGPWPGTVYQQDQSDGALGFYESSGAWRVGIQCETSVESYPYRWAIGTRDQLVAETAPDGEVFYYLPPDEQVVTWGAIRMTELIDAQNPQRCWAGLIHEDVEISLLNQNVGPREIRLVETTE